MKNPALSDADLFLQFESYLRTERYLASNTIVSYLRTLTRFAARLPHGLRAASRDELRTLFGHLRARKNEPVSTLHAVDSLSRNEGLSPSSVAQKLYAVRHFYQFLRRKGVISSIPLKNIAIPKLGYRLPKPVGNADFVKLLQIVEREMPEVRPSPVLERVQQPMIPRFIAHMTAQEEAKASREKLITERLAQGPCLVSQMTEYLQGRGLDVCGETVRNDYRRLGIVPPIANAQRLQERALLRILDSCGLRVSEVTALKSKDLNVGEGYLFVRQSKGDKDRFVPMDQPAIDALREYLQRARGILYPGEKSDRVFPITRQRAWQIIHALGERAGTSELYPHQLRHRFGTEMTKAGMGQREVADLMGHTSVDTTQGYVALDTAHLEESFRKFHPRAVKR